MALAHLMLTSPACCCCYLDEQRNSGSRGLISLFGSGNGIYRVPGRYSPVKVRSRRRREFFVEGRGRLNATKLQTRVENNGQIRTVEIPVSCYQIIGVPDQAEKDEIARSVLSLKSKKVDEGYTSDVVGSREKLLMDVRDKLFFEQEYAGNTREKVPPKSSLRIPWSWLPASLCLLNEVGEMKLVLEIGQAALQLSDAKPYVHDVLFSMALAECAISKMWMNERKVSQGFEALEHAQYLLTRLDSLGKVPLLSEVEEDLEERCPAYILEVLGMPLAPQNAERRRRVIAILQVLLWQGLDAETSRGVKDWPSFLDQALIKLMATEIVDLLHWNDLAVTRKNKQSIESQNLRAVIDLNCFYKAMKAHIAVGFSSKQTDLINKAKIICECLVASDGMNLKFEEALCSFLLGQGTEAAAGERLRELEINSGPVSRNIISSFPENEKNGSSVKLALEKWLKDVVLSSFPDTRDCSPSLANFFGGEKRNIRSESKKQNIGTPKTVHTVSRRPSTFVLSPDHGGSEEPFPYLNSTRHLGGVAVKQLAPADLQSPLMAGKTNGGSNSAAPSVQLKRNLGVHHKNIWRGWSFPVDMVQRITFITVLGCIVFTFKLLGMQFGYVKSLSRWDSTILKTNKNTLAWTMDPSPSRKAAPTCIDPSSIGGGIRKLMSMLKKLKHQPIEQGMQSSLLVEDLLPLTKPVHKREMPVEEAEALVKQWQIIKAEALGPDHEIQNLSEVLAESMLAEWQALADSAKVRSCFWRFVLLQLSVLRANIMSDGIGGEMAEIEALLEEAAELVDESQPKNPNYYSSYKIRYVLRRQCDGSWRFCAWGIQTPA